MVGERWINLDAIDFSHGDTALHLVCRSTKPEALSIVELLLNARAHADCSNKHDKTPLSDAKIPQIKALLQKLQTPSLLKCLSARCIVREQLNYESIWPSGSKFHSFVYLHGCLAQQKHSD